MNMTRNPVTSVHTKLIAIWFWPIWLTASPTVRPFFMSPTGMSPTLPVMVPAGSPFALSAAAGAARFLMSASVIATGAGAGAAAAGAAAGACANAALASARVDAIDRASRVRCMSRVFMGIPLLPPDGVLLIRRVDDTDDADEAHHDADEHH